ncbi:hypothetical protein QQP08_017326 [Theobroma cacao]|nr:hypothetical protein QQP08_017326 [Theobroma cacao]
MPTGANSSEDLHVRLDVQTRLCDIVALGPQSGAPLPGNVGNGSILPSFEHLVSLLKRAFGFHSDINLVPDIESVRTGLYHV